MRINGKQKITAVLAAIAIGSCFVMPYETGKQPVTVQAEDTAATTQQAASAAEQAVKKDTGFGVALMNGEAMNLTFDTSESVLIPIKTDQAGYMTIMRTDSNEDAVSVSVWEQSDEKTKFLDGESVEGEDDTGAFAIAEGDYYIMLQGTVGTSCTLSIKMTAGMEIASGENTSIALGSHSVKDAFYLQMKAGSTGLMNVENMGSSKLQVKLCNTDKKALSGTKTLERYTSKNHKNYKNIAAYGVKAGEEYLICVSAASSVKKATIKYKIEKHGSRGGAALDSASALRRGKTVGATLAAGAPASYFKFQKSGYRQMRVSVKTFRNQGKMRVSLYYKEIKGKNKGKIMPVKVSGRQVGWTQGAQRQNVLKVPANWPKVTYYLKMSNATGTASGSYYLTVK